MDSVWINQEAGKVRIGDKVVVKGFEGELIDRYLIEDDVVRLCIKSENCFNWFGLNYAHAVKFLETDPEEIAYLRENFPKMF